MNALLRHWRASKPWYKLYSKLFLVFVFLAAYLGFFIWMFYAVAARPALEFQHVFLYSVITGLALILLGFLLLIVVLPWVGMVMRVSSDASTSARASVTAGFTLLFLAFLAAFVRMLTK